MAVPLRTPNGNGTVGGSGGGDATAAVSVQLPRSLYRNKNRLDTIFLDGNNINIDMRKEVELMHM